ncbi:pYEATS domain-containing protein [Xanthobacter flavus]|uniref:pYEATS domain-containing protein n=1 Tax=Xanthobacter flavus TaxID=281 RepID=UPI00372C7611
MKTSLHFEAPSDLSVGTIRITGEGKTVADWVATPDNRTFSQDDLKPGIYSAEIGPAGVPPQSVIFRVQEGQANTVVLPPFSALSASGSNTSFFDDESLRTTSTLPRSISESLSAKAGFKTIPSSEFVSQLILNEPERPSQPVAASAEGRRFSIGLSEECRGRDAFDSFRGRTNLEVFPGRIEVELPTDPGRDLWAGHRVRLSLAVQRRRVERCLLPLYAGGTRIIASVPPFSPADVELKILPIDAKLRSLVRALDAGTSAEAAAVRDDVIGKDDPVAQLGQGGDPWAAILGALLPIRFSDVFSPLSSRAIERFVNRASWSYDAHVVHASHLLASGEDAKPDLQEQVVQGAIIALESAQVAGSPYYRYASQLFGEMVSSIDAYLGNTEHGISAPTVNRFYRVKARWRREIPLQRGSGPTFTWLSRDPAALKEHRLLTPNNKSSGRLRSRDCRVLFEGRVSNGQIAIVSQAAEQPAAEKRPSSDGVTPNLRVPSADNRSIPAFARPPGPRDDPNKGRFGGTAERAGYRLSATFERAEDRNRVLIQLIVEANPSAKVSLGDFAWFVLHPTFSPQVLKVAFRGSRARVRVQAWGGFTVGVWLPGSNVELECDLSAVKDAPATIRNR